MKFQIGDRVIPTERCREVWKSNRFGKGIGTVVEAIHDDMIWVEWDTVSIRYFYKPQLLELVVPQLEND